MGGGEGGVAFGWGVAVGWLVKNLLASFWIGFCELLVDVPWDMRQMEVKILRLFSEGIETLRSIGVIWKDTIPRPMYACRR